MTLIGEIMDRYGPAYVFLLAVALVGCVVEAPSDETPMDMAETTGGSRSGDAADETIEQVFGNMNIDIIE